MRNKRSAFPRAFISAILLLLFAGCEKKQEASPGLPQAQFVEVLQKDVPITKKWVATLDGFANAQIRAQVRGLLVKQNYTNGAFVSKDTALFEIDIRSPTRSGSQTENSEATINSH